MRSSKCVEQRLDDRAWRKRVQRRANFCGSKRTVKRETSSSQPIQTTRADKAHLCHDNGTFSSRRRTTICEAQTGAEAESKRQSRSST